MICYDTHNSIISKINNSVSKFQLFRSSAPLDWNSAEHNVSLKCDDITALSAFITVYS